MLSMVLSDVFLDLVQSFVWACDKAEHPSKNMLWVSMQKRLKTSYHSLLGNLVLVIMLLSWNENEVSWKEAFNQNKTMGKCA